jgi:hypothetical protein
MQERPSIPEPIKRKVRQRCSFGCIICGCLIYEYHHMEGWAETQEHKAETLTLLCNLHHAEVTKGLLPSEKVEKANNLPFNRQNGQSKEYLLHYDESVEYEILLGNNKFYFSNKTVRLGSSVYIAFVNGQPLLEVSFEDNMVFLSCNLFDRDNNLVLKIDKNELVYSTSRWDVKFVGKRLTINNAPRDIILDMVFEPPSKLVINRADLYYQGVYFEINEKGVGKPDILGRCPTMVFVPSNPLEGYTALGETEFRHFDCVFLFGSIPECIINGAICRS